MSYIIRKSDGSLLVELQDEVVDSNASSITLVGKNLSNYGEYWNTNLIRLLENFSNTQQPNNPIVGQLWYDRSSSVMKVYSDKGMFESLIPSYASPGIPENVSFGQIWIDSTNNQLKFTTDSTDFILAGPIYTKSQGKSGFVVESILDINGDLKDITCLYNKGTFIAAISEVSFTVNDGSLSSVGFIQDMFAGINFSQVLPGVLLNGASSRSFLADNVINFSAILSPSNIPPIYLTNYPGGMEYTTGTLKIINNGGLKIGLHDNVVIRAQGALVSNDIQTFITHDIADRPLTIQGKNLSTGYFTAIRVDAANKRIGILTDFPQTTLDLNGDATIRGNLNVLGTTTYIVSNDLRINDKNIELNYSTSPVTDSLAEGGGVILKGTSDHSITWTNSYDKSWEINDNFNLTNSTSTYKIAGVTVLSGNSLGQTISSGPGLTNVGVLDYLTVTNITITTGTISSIDSDLNLIPALGNNVNLNFNKISNLSTCTNNFDAANKQYVDNSLFQFTSRFSFTVDETLMLDPVNEILSLLNLMFPISNGPPYDALDIPDGSRARILCSTSTFATPSIPSLPSSRTAVTVDQGGILNSVSVLQDINFSLPSEPIVVGRTYKVREYLVVSGSWSYTGIVT